MRMRGGDLENSQRNTNLTITKGLRIVCSGRSERKRATPRSLYALDEQWTAKRHCVLLRKYQRLIP